MSTRRQSLEARRQALLQRSAEQRARISREIAVMTAGVDRIDRRVAAVRRFASAPVLAAGGALLAVALGRKRMIKLLGFGLAAATTASRVPAISVFLNRLLPMVIGGRTAGSSGAAGTTRTSGGRDF